MKHFRTIRMWVIGAALFALRFYQNTHDFDNETGLHTLSYAGIALVALIAVAVIAAFRISRRESWEKPPFNENFSVPHTSLTPLITGIFLLAAGGALLAKNAFSSEFLVGSTSAANIASVAVAVLVILSAFCLLLLTRQMRRGSTPSLILVLPSMFFTAFWVLSLYLPSANDPVLAHYCLPILAAASAAYAFSQLAGFFRRETAICSFLFMSECAVILCLAAAAELNVHSLLYLGCALIFTVFSVLQKPKTAK